MAWSVVLVPLAVLIVPLGLAHLEARMLADGPPPGTPPDPRQRRDRPPADDPPRQAGTTSTPLSGTRP